MGPSAPRHILVRGPNWVGDLVMATPGFRALRAGFPEARITLHVRSGLEPLMDGAPWFDGIRVLGAAGTGPLAPVRDGLALGKLGFDLGLCLPDSVSSALVMRLARARPTVGYATPLRAHLLDRPVPPLPPRAGRRLQPREAHVLGLVRAIGCPALGSQLELFVTAGEEQQAERSLRARGVSPDTPFAALAPGASYGPAKCWPPASFAAVGDALAAEGLRVVLIGAPAEAPLARRVADAMRASALDLCGALDLGVLKAVLRRARLLVCNDAGARHVAVALRVPCVVIFGPTSLEKTSWNLEGVAVLASEVSCRPCYHRRCPTDHRCMERLAPRRVIEAARGVLSRVGEET